MLRIVARSKGRATCLSATYDTHDQEVGGENLSSIGNHMVSGKHVFSIESELRKKKKEVQGRSISLRSNRAHNLRRPAP